jgi:DNA repair protein RadD
MQLRGYQIAALRRFEQSKHKSCLIVAPTGAGKGTMAVELLFRAHRAGKKALFLVHRREIVNDIIDRLKARGVKVAQTLYSDRHVRVVSVQSLLRAHILPVDLLVVDEAHHYAADEWKEVVARVQCRRVVGFTATPQRADGRPLGDMFTDIIDTVSYSDLTRAGLLVPARVLRPIAKLGNDLAQDPVETYLRFAKGEQALVFVRRVADADEVRDRLRREGIAAESVHANTKKEKRDDIMLRLERGEVRVVANVGTLTEGVDVPHVTVCIVARPCAHAATYVQIVGRVLRAAPGKKLATVIDLVGASHAHGLPGADMAYSLEGDGLHVRTPQERESRSGPSGPHREQEVLDLDLECVHTYAPKVAPPPPAPKPKPEPKPKPVKVPGGGSLQMRLGGWWYLRVYSQVHGNVSKALHTKDRAAAEKLARLYRQDKDAFAAALAPLRVRQGQAKYNPKSRPAPAVRTVGSLFQDKGFWFAQWSELGKKYRMGLCTKDRAVAEETRAILRDEGPDAMRAEVLKRKRSGASIWRKQGKTTGPGIYYMKAWNDERTDYVQYTLGTRDKELAERMRDLFSAGKRKEFDRLCAQNREEIEREGREARKRTLLERSASVAQCAE